MNWQHELNIKQFLNKYNEIQEIDYPLSTCIRDIIRELEKCDKFCSGEGEFLLRELTEVAVSASNVEDLDEDNDDIVEDFDDLMGNVYDFCDENKIWLGTF